MFVSYVMLDPVILTILTIAMTVGNIIYQKKKKKRPTRFKEVILLSVLMKISEVNEYLQGALSSPQKHYCIISIIWNIICQDIY